MNLGTTLEKVDRAIWQRIADRIILPSGILKEVVQQEPDSQKQSNKPYDCKFVLKRVNITHNKERGNQGAILIPDGTASIKLQNGETVQGPALYQEYSSPVWVKVLYQCSYMANSLKVDRICSEGVLRLIECYKYIEAEAGCNVFVRVFDSLKSVISDPKMEIFERAITWEAEVPLKAEYTGTVPAIITHSYEILPVNELPEV